MFKESITPVEVGVGGDWIRDGEGKEENTRLQNQLEEVRIKAEKREDEIEELYTLQDDLEQY